MQPTRSIIWFNLPAPLTSCSRKARKSSILQSPSDHCFSLRRINKKNVRKYRQMILFSSAICQLMWTSEAAARRRLPFPLTTSYSNLHSMKHRTRNWEIGDAAKELETRLKLLRWQTILVRNPIVWRMQARNLQSSRLYNRNRQLWKWRMRRRMMIHWKTMLRPSSNKNH